MQLIYHPLAEREVIEAARYYEQRVTSLGAQFLAAVDLAASAITGAPERWRIIELDVRQYLMPRFPYAVYYRIVPGQVRILAVKHHRRHPDYWRSRLEN